MYVNLWYNKNEGGMVIMKKKLPILMILPLLTLLSSCSLTTTNSQPFNNLNSLEQVTLTFVQHTFLRFSFDESKEIDGYYFLNDELAKTSLKFNKGHNLSYDDINNFNSFSLNYELPNLVGDGYWSFTFFTISFNEDSGFSSDFLKPCELYEDLILHFAIYG